MLVTEFGPGSEAMAKFGAKPVDQGVARIVDAMDALHKCVGGIVRNVTGKANEVEVLTEAVVGRDSASRRPPLALVALPKAGATF